MAATVGVALVGTASLALAQLGHHDGVASVAIATAVGLGLLAWARREGLRPVAGIPELVLAGTHRAGQPVPVATGLPVCVRRQGPGDLRRARPRHRPRRRRGARRPRAGGGPPGGAVRARSPPPRRLDRGRRALDVPVLPLLLVVDSHGGRPDRRTRRLPPERAPRRAVRRGPDARGSPGVRAADRGDRGRAPRHLAPAGVADEVPDH